LRLTSLIVGLLLALTPLNVAAQTDVAQADGAAALVGLGPQRTERIEAELVPLSHWATPGSTVIVAVRQKIQPGWHTYWRNPGDSGGPTTLNWTLPDGLRADDIVWPLPERQRLQSLVNYGYSGDVLLPVPIEVPASARPGQVLTLRAQALFMVCSDQMCVPDELPLALDVEVREGAAPLDPTYGAAIQSVLTAAPRPAPIEARIALEEGRLTLSAAGGPLADADIGRAHFFPFQGGIIDHAADQTATRGDQGLTLTLAPGRGARGGLSGPVPGVLATDAGAWEITAEPGAALAGTNGRAISGEAGEREASAGGATTATGLLQAAVLALLGGLILNLMPCVFPILAMKAAALSASAHEARVARRDGLLFLAGVLATFLVLAGALLALRAGGQAVGWGFQLQSPAVIAVLGLLMLAVALNLSGVFDIGGSLQGAGRLSHVSGGAGAFLTGVLAVVVAAPCTAPFMAVALGAALVMPWPAALLVFLMLGLGLALPYMVVSLSPGLLRRFPRPGPWMERLRRLLAFPMYGAALWLAWVFARQTGGAALALLFGAGLLLALALWLFGAAQGERAAGRRGWFSGGAALVALALAAVAGVAAARVPALEPGEASAGTVLASQPWSPEAVQTALGEGRPVLVNFTADWCVTCKINEGAALSSARVGEAITATNAVYLVGDWTRRDDAITRELERHGRSGVPLYLLHPASGGEPRILPQLLTEGLVIDSLQEAAR
jgi:thiol:disulfide interchange protein DsbD